MIEKIKLILFFHIFSIIENSLIIGLRRSAGLNLLNHALSLHGNGQVFFVHNRDFTILSFNRLVIFRAFENTFEIPCQYIYNPILFNPLQHRKTYFHSNWHGKDMPLIDISLTLKSLHWVPLTCTIMLIFKINIKNIQV